MIKGRTGHDGDAYFADWESRLGTTKDLDARYVERKRSYDSINRLMQDARTSFLDFNSILTQIRALVEGGPNAAGRAEARELFGKANWRCIDVQQALANMEIEFDRLAASFAKDQG